IGTPVVPVIPGVLPTEPPGLQVLALRSANHHPGNAALPHSEQPYFRVEDVPNAVRLTILRIERRGSHATHVDKAVMRDPHVVRGRMRRIPHGRTVFPPVFVRIEPW